MSAHQLRCIPIVCLELLVEISDEVDHEIQSRDPSPGPGSNDPGQPEVVNVRVRDCEYLEVAKPIADVLDRLFECDEAGG